MSRVLVGGLVAAAVLILGMRVFSGESRAEQSDNTNLLAMAAHFKSDANRSAVESSIRQAIPAVETYAATNGGYEGMTPAGLAALDPGISQSIRVVRATPTSYCLEGRIGTAVASQTGPGGSVAEGPCAP